MKKTIRVLVAGVPTCGLETQAWRKNATFKVRGKKPEVPTSKLFESFKPGATNRLRKRVVAALKESGELLRRDITAEVDDLGEIIPEEFARQFQGEYGLKEEDLVALAKQFAEQCKDYDLAVLLGGDHAGGLLLYAIEGKLARFDEHSDSCATPLACPSGVMRNNYVCTAIRAELKKAEEIKGVGVRQGEAPYEVALFAKDCSILDFDLDVLAQKYGVKSRYSKGNLSPDALVGAIRMNSPKAIGIFEFVDGDEVARELVEKLAIEAAIAACKKRL